MGEKSNIEWTEATWNPVTGCMRVSPGCANCYAKREHDRRHKGYLAGNVRARQYAEPFEVVQLHGDRLDYPLLWRQPRRVFVCSGADLFHEDVPISFIAEVFDRMACATVACGKRHEHVEECWTGEPHTFILLTKRPERMRWALTEGILEATAWWRGDSPLCVATMIGAWPLPNVHVGVSVENKDALWRVKLLLQTPAAVRLVSYEPALGPVDLQPALWTHAQDIELYSPGIALDGVICGGESGPNARPMHPDWPRKVRDDCAAAGVPFFFKQWGEWAPAVLPERKDRTISRFVCSVCGEHGAIAPKPINDHWEHCRSGVTEVMYRIGKKAAGRILDGRVHDDLPGTLAMKEGG